jgi:hypothetical protein
MYKPNGNYCSICNIHDQWCEHVKPPVKLLDQDTLTDEQREELSRRFGNKIQTIELKVTLSFNNLGWTDEADLPTDRVADGVASHMGVLWHVPALGADKYIFDKDKHKPDCITLTDPIGHFKTCDCGAYGEQGPPRNFWSLMSKFTRVEVVATKVELIQKEE